MENTRLESGNYYHIYNRGNNRMNLFEQPSDYEHFLWLYDRYILPVAETLAWVLMPNHFHLLVKIKENVVYKFSKDRPIKINANADKSATPSGYGDAEWEKFFEENKWETIDLSASAGPDNIESYGKSKSAGPDNIESCGKSKSAGPDNIESCGKSKSAGPARLYRSGGTDHIGEGGINLNADRSATLSDLSATLSGLTVNNKKPETYKHFSHLFNAYTRYLHTRTGRTGNLFERPFKRILIDNDEYLKNVILYIHHNPVHHGFCSHPLEYPWSSYLSCISDKPTKLKRDTVTCLFGGTDELKNWHDQKLEKETVEKWLGLED